MIPGVSFSLPSETLEGGLSPDPVDVRTDGHLVGASEGAPGVDLNLTGAVPTGRAEEGVDIRLHDDGPAVHDECEWQRVTHTLELLEGLDDRVEDSRAEAASGAEAKRAPGPPPTRLTACHARRAGRTPLRPSSPELRSSPIPSSRPFSRGAPLHPAPADKEVTSAAHGTPNGWAQRHSSIGVHGRSPPRSSVSKKVQLKQSATSARAEKRCGPEMGALPDQVYRAGARILG